MGIFRYLSQRKSRQSQREIVEFGEFGAERRKLSSSGIGTLLDRHHQGGQIFNVRPWDELLNSMKFISLFSRTKKQQTKLNKITHARELMPGKTVSWKKQTWLQRLDGRSFTLAPSLCRHRHMSAGPAVPAPDRLAM